MKKHRNAEITLAAHLDYNRERVGIVKDFNFTDPLAAKVVELIIREGEELEIEEKLPVDEYLELHPAFECESVMGGNTETFINAARSEEKKFWNGLPSPSALSSIMENPPVEPAQVLRGLLYRGGKLALDGKSKARKSWTLYHLALAVANGHTWLGFETQKSRVLLLDLELLPHETPQRLLKIANSMGVKSLDNIHIQQLRGFRIDIDQMKKPLINYCRINQIGLIIFDPWYKLTGGKDEIGTEHVSEYLFKLEEIAMRTGAAVAFAHHFAKGDSSQKEAIDAASGSGVFARDPDCKIVMRELTDSTEVNPRAKMEFVVRSFAPVMPVGLRWEFPVWVRDNSLNLELKRTGSGGCPSHTVHDILNVLGSKRLTVGEWKNRCEIEKGMSGRTFSYLKAQARDSGLIEQHQQGRVVQCQLAKRMQKQAKDCTHQTGLNL